MSNFGSPPAKPGVYTLLLNMTNKRTIVNNNISNRYRINDLIINLRHNPFVWQPSEYANTFLKILDSIDLFGLKICDVGCGSGILAIFCALRGGKVTALDLNPYAIKLCRENAILNNVSINCIQSNVFSAISKDNEKFDLIVCNPPTFPITNLISKQTALYWNQNIDSREVLDEVLNTGKLYLNSDGKILISSSSEQIWDKTKEALSSCEYWKIHKKITFKLNESYKFFVDEWYKFNLIKKIKGVYTHEVHFIEAKF